MDELAQFVNTPGGQLILIIMLAQIAALIYVVRNKNGGGDVKFLQQTTTALIQQTSKEAHENTAAIISLVKGHEKIVAQTELGNALAQQNVQRIDNLSGILDKLGDHIIGYTRRSSGNEAEWLQLSRTFVSGQARMIELLETLCDQRGPDKPPTEPASGKSEAGNVTDLDAAKAKATVSSELPKASGM